MEKSKKVGEWEFLLTLCSLAKYILIPFGFVFGISLMAFYLLTTLAGTMEAVILSLKISVWAIGLGLILAEIIDLAVTVSKWCRKHSASLVIQDKKEYSK